MRARNTLALVPALALAIGLGAAQAPASGLGPAAAGGAEGVPGFGHVFLIIGRNRAARPLQVRDPPLGNLTHDPRWPGRLPGATFS